MSDSQLVTKKVINSPETCVDDNLRGVVATFPMLHLHPKNRVVTVRNKADTGRVAILGGGGSGHEPFAAGFVGAGMLDGAVAGGVFASPPTGHVHYAISQLYKYNSGGVLVIIGNYTGDRLNFGKAIEKAKIAGVKVEGLIVGEDVASSQNKTGGRAMVGEVLFYKICGALSQIGWDLTNIRDMAAEANKFMATLGVCLNACSLPGQPPLFEIKPDEMELGAGVHGEAGIAKVKMGTAKEIVTMILDQVVKHLNLVSGHRVVASINNLGGTSIFEMNIISAEIKEYLASKNIILERTYSGHLKSSLEMHGFQICLLHLNEEHGDLWLELLDAPSCTGAWNGCQLSTRSEEPHVDDDALRTSDGWQPETGPTFSAAEQTLVREGLLSAANNLIESEVKLNKLDSGCGDGDCGTTLRRFAEEVLKYLETASLDKPSKLLWDLAEIAETGMGGTSGGIYSLGLAAASQSFANASSGDRSAWLAAWESAIEAISKYGGAEPGDRTLLDTLHGGAEAFKEHYNTERDMKAFVRRIGQALETETQKTATMVARAGRASYVSPRHALREDAGARGAAVWLHSVLGYITDHAL